ncbi:hypothetical protein [Desulfomicrobium orale]|uniref:hypothetical protein n=1 Tax=Desulfomicrobium orale TaxID=132132 RepID=UPI0014702C03|nr:hypothetical protein [Desulfomicrobium orale]
MGQLLSGYQFIYRDLMILLRYIIYSMAIIAGAYAATEIIYTKSIKFILIAILFISIAISFLQYFDIFNVNSIMIPIYGEKYHTLITGESWRRIVGTIGNANYWGLWLAICLVATSSFLVLNHKIVLIPVIILLFLSIIMTGSRTAIFSSLFGVCCGIFFFVKHVESAASLKKTLFLCSLFMLFPLLFFTTKYFIADYYDNQSRFSLDNTHTLELRVMHWSNFISETIEHPYRILIGRGSAKTDQTTYGDNSYLMIFRDYGLLSVFLYIILLLRIIFRLKKGVKSSFPKIKILSTTSLLITLTFIFFDIAADAWFNVRLVIPLLFGYGYMIIKIETEDAN